MQLSKKKRRWISIGVGIVGLVTIVGLSDLLFLLPQQTPPSQRVQTAQQPSTQIPQTQNTTATTTQTQILQKEKNATSGTIEFSL